MTSLRVTLLALFFIGTCCEEGARGLQRQYAKRWHTSADVIKAEVKSTTKLFLQSRDKTLDIPIEVDIILVGLDGEGGYGFRLDPTKLEELLTGSFREHCPSIWETEESSTVCFQMSYQVFFADKDFITKLERKIQANLTAASTSASGLPAFQVDGAALEEVLNGYLSSLIKDKDTEPIWPNSEASWHQHNTLFVLNLDKARMTPKGVTAPKGSGAKVTDFIRDWQSGAMDLDKLRAQEAGYVYRYEYEGSGSSCSWVGAGKYAVVDLSAGPCDFGPIASRSGAVDPTSLPRIQDLMQGVLQQLRAVGAGTVFEHALGVLAAQQTNLLVGQLASVATSAVQHLFVPDTTLLRVEQAERLMVVVLHVTDHLIDDDDTGGPRGREVPGMDLDALSAAVTALSEQRDAVVTHSHHYLHHHPQLAAALHKAIHARSSAAVVPGEAGGGFHVSTTSCIDSAVVLEEFARATDVLAMALTASSLAEEDAQQLSFTSGMQMLRHTGTRVMPVWVLSLRHAPDSASLVFDTHHPLVAADHNAVVVLQLLGEKEGTKHEPLFTGHISNGQRVAIDTQEVTRHVVAGLAMGLTGVAPPFSRFDTPQQRYVFDWTWAVGAHPFGPYSSSSRVSALLVAASRRNALLSHVANAVHGMADSLAAVEDFLVLHFRGPFAHAGVASSMDSDVKREQQRYWLDAVSTRHVPENSSLPQKFGSELHTRVAELDDDIQALSFQLYALDFGDAAMKVEDLLFAVGRLTDTVAASLEVANNAMVCCRFVVQHHRNTVLAITITIVFLVMAFVGLLFGVCATRPAARGSPQAAMFGVGRRMFSGPKSWTLPS